MKEILENLKSQVNKHDSYIPIFKAEIYPETQFCYEKILVQSDKGFGMTFLKEFIKIVEKTSQEMNVDLTFFVGSDTQILIFNINKNIK